MMRIRIPRANVLEFGDGSAIELNDHWRKALADKLKHEKKSFAEFLEEFGKWLEERWETKTCSDRFGHVMKWEEVDDDSLVDDLSTLADLARNELYCYLRARIMGLALSGHGGNAIIITDSGIVEYPDTSDLGRSD